VKIDEWIWRRGNPMRSRGREKSRGYAFVQAAGMINNHIVTCCRWREVQKP
jgi:3-methyladenine DNA glycosylase Tag